MITGITISPYNSQANGLAERTHWDVRQSLYKATGGNPDKWFWFFYHVLWADRITVRRGLGCSPFFALTGAHPIIPLDIIEATWLVELPDRTLKSHELIGFRARALAKHEQHVREMHARITEEKKRRALAYEKEHAATIRNFDFKPGNLVLMRNTAIEKNLDRKMFARYLGPLVVLRRTKGGAYILCEMDGAVLDRKVAAFRLVPYEARYSIVLPENIHKLIDLSVEGLKELENSPEDEEGDVEEANDPKVDFIFKGVRLKSTKDLENQEDLDSDDSSSGDESVGSKSSEESSDSEDSEDEEVDYREAPRRSGRVPKPVHRRDL